MENVWAGQVLFVLFLLDCVFLMNNKSGNVHTTYIHILLVRLIKTHKIQKYLKKPEKKTKQKHQIKKRQTKKKTTDCESVRNYGNVLTRRNITSNHQASKSWYFYFFRAFFFFVVHFSLSYLGLRFTRRSNKNETNKMKISKHIFCCFFLFWLLFFQFNSWNGKKSHILFYLIFFSSFFLFLPFVRDTTSSQYIMPIAAFSLVLSFSLIFFFLFFLSRVFSLSSSVYVCALTRRINVHIWVWIYFV